MNRPIQSIEDIEQVIKKAFEPSAENVVFAHEADTDGLDLSDHSVESNLLREEDSKDGIAIPELPKADTTVDDSSAFDDNPVVDAQTAIKEAFSKDYDFSSIVVDSIERDRFYRCGLHDQEMYFDVELLNYGMLFKVAIPSTSQSEAVITTLDTWAAKGYIGSNSVQFLHNYQLLNAWLMVREINHVPTEWFGKELEEAEGKITRRRLQELLSTPEVLEPLHALSSVKWSAVSLAIRIADHKYSLCMEAVRSRKVFMTAGSA